MENRAMYELLMMKFEKKEKHRKSVNLDKPHLIVRNSE